MGADGGPLNSTQCQLHFFKPPLGTGAGTHGSTQHIFLQRTTPGKCSLPEGDQMDAEEPLLFYCHFGDFWGPSVEY